MKKVLKSGISQIPRGMAENTVEMRKDSAKSGNVGITVILPVILADP